MTPTVELPLASPAASISPARYQELARRVKLLSWLSLAAMSVEGAVALFAGIVAGSIALVGFGLDSAIEGFASVIIIWRFTGSRVMSQAAEQRAQKLVAAQFFILAPYVGVESIRALAGGEHPDVSVLGMALAVLSLITMPLLGVAKQRIADQIGSAATKGEGRQNVLCAYLAGALLIGLAGNAIAGAWWLDPVVGLLIAGVAVKEGLEGLARRGLLRRLPARRLRRCLRRRLLPLSPAHPALVSVVNLQRPSAHASRASTIRPRSASSSASFASTRASTASSRYRRLRRRAVGIVRGERVDHVVQREADRLEPTRQPDPLDGLGA